MRAFQINTLSATPNPQQTIWLAMHQDYCEDYVWDRREQVPDETTAGQRVIKHLLSGGRGHWGPCEHPQIVLATGYFPHSTMQQIRTHRHISVDCQSNRYTGDRILDVVDGKRELEDVFYLRPGGWYCDRSGNKYKYTETERQEDLQYIHKGCQVYAERVRDGIAKEQARSIIPFDVRQHFVISGNLRTMLHLLDLRWKKDAQPEAQSFAELLFANLQAWCPEISQWYLDNRAHKAKLAP